MRRALLTLIGFFTGAALTWSAILRLLGAIDVPRPQITLDAVQAIRQQIDSQVKLSRGNSNVVMLGDSLLMGPQQNSTTWVNGVTQELLAAKSQAAGSSASLRAIVFTGLSLYSHYFLLDEILAMKPDLVVLELNLYYFSRFWQGRDRVHLATLMPAHRWPRLLVLQPELVGLTVDEMMLYRGIYSAGELDNWRWLQAETARLAKAYWIAAEAVQSRVGAPDGLRFRDQHRLRYLGKRSLPFRERATPYYARELLGRALDGHVEGHAVLDVLMTLIEELRRNGVTTLVYVPPYNVEHLKSIGVWNQAGIDRTVKTARLVAEGAGATFVDFHGVLPDSAFRDTMDHLTDVGERSGVHLLADRLSQAILDALPNERGR